MKETVFLWYGRFFPILAIVGTIVGSSRLAHRIFDTVFEYLNPQYTFFAAVSRKDGMNRPKEGFNMTEGISREDALKGITIWAATANFEEAEKGSLEAGKYADFVIYDQSFLTDDLIQIRNSFPFKTFVNGQEVAHHQ